MEQIIFQDYVPYDLFLTITLPSIQVSVDIVVNTGRPGEFW